MGWLQGNRKVLYDSIDTNVDGPLAFLVFTRGSRDLAMTLDMDLP